MVRELNFSGPFLPQTNQSVNKIWYFRLKGRLDELIIETWLENEAISLLKDASTIFTTGMDYLPE